MSAEHVAELAEWLREETRRHLAAIKVVSDGKYFWIWDGFHRFDAYGMAGRTEIPAEVTKGDHRLAVFLSASANTDIVLKRTPADKWRAVSLLMRDKEWRELPDGKIADHCGVCRQFVAKVREAHLVNVNKIDPKPPRTVQRGGATFKMEVGPIGKRLGLDKEESPKPKAEEPATPKLVRALITLDEDLVEAIDKAARRANRNREAQIVVLLRKQLGL